MPFKSKKKRSSFFGRRKRKGRENAALPSTQKEREEQNSDRLGRREARHDPDSKLNIAMPYVWIALSILSGLCLYTSGGGIVGVLLRFLLLSFFSYAAYVLPVALFLLGIFHRRLVTEGKLGRRSLVFLGIVILLLSMIYVLTLSPEEIAGTIPKEEVTLDGGSYFNYAAPAALRGGFLGALIGWILYRLVGPVLTIVLVALAVLLYGIFGFGFSPDAIVRSSMRALRARREARQKKRAELVAEEAERVMAERLARNGSRIEEEADGEPLKTAEADEAPTVQEGSTVAKGEQAVPQRSFTDLFAAPAESRPAEPSPEATPPRDAEAELRAFKEQRIRERLRSHDGIHTYAVSDLRPSTITEPPEPPAASASFMDEGGITSMRADTLIAPPEEAEDTAPFRGVEDFRRITVSEPVRVHAAPASPTPLRETPTPVYEAPAPRYEPAPAPITPLEAEKEDLPLRATVREGDTLVDRSETHTVHKASPARPKGPVYEFPPTTLLQIPSLSEDTNEEEIQKNADTLVKTLESFGIPITITGYTRGPRITRYEFVQKAGIRVSKVASYADDITQKLSTQGVRIEAPIPNKSSIGVEVPNRKSPPVRIRSLLDTETFRDAASKTTVAIGCDVTGTPVFFDIAKAPHMLIAGATGMGKSVCINSLLISLLYKASPEDVRLILIDPKKVEFNVYSRIPHLLIPVVTDPTKAAGALNWAVNEMEKRYDMIEEVGVRDIKGYNAYCEENRLPTLPKIVIVIDELNDLMMTARKMVEASICRIAQKARAAGIHLIIGTQRPSVNVITGDIKVNIPARIAFRVNQLVDSRTILDMQGAEKLLPQGDMLFSPAGTPQRVQGAFVADEEVKSVVSFLAERVGGAVFDDAILADIEKETAKCAQKNGDDGDDEEMGGGSLDGVMDDPKFEQALDIAFSTGSISTSLLQRRIGVGFGRASRFIDAMCEMGIVGEARGGAKPRELLLSRAEYEDRKRRLFDE